MKCIYVLSAGKMWMPALHWQWAHQAHTYLEDIKPGLSRALIHGVVAGATTVYVGSRLYRRYQARRRIEERGNQARQACEKLKQKLRNYVSFNPIHVPEFFCVIVHKSLHE